MKPLFFSLSLVALLGLAPHDVAPDFTLNNQDAKPITLSSFQGKPVLLFFYPKDNTPGCTKQSCMLRDSFKKFQEQGTVIFGISTQNEKSHQAFIKEHKLPFDLRVDTDGRVAALYGVKNRAGFLERKSVLIGPNGKVFKYYESVDPSSHADKVLADLSALRIGSKP